MYVGRYVYFTFKCTRRLVARRFLCIHMQEVSIEQGGSKFNCSKGITNGWLDLYDFDGFWGRLRYEIIVLSLQYFFLLQI